MGVPALPPPSSCSICHATRRPLTRHPSVLFCQTCDQAKCLNCGSPHNSSAVRCTVCGVTVEAHLPKGTKA